MIKHCLLLLVLTGAAYAQDSRVTLSPSTSPAPSTVLTLKDEKGVVLTIDKSGEVAIRTGVTLSVASQQFWQQLGKTFTSLAPPPVPCPPPPVVEQEKHFCNLPADWATYLLPNARLCVMRPGI